MKQCIIVTLGILFLLTSCIDSSKNTIGFVGSGVTPTEITIPDSCFTNQFSYQDTTKNYANNTSLFLGKNENKTAKVLMKFTNLPDSISQISEFKLKLPFTKNNTNNNYSFIFSRIIQTWNENEADKLNATSNTVWDNPDEISVNPFVVDDYTIENDSLIFNFNSNSSNLDNFKNLINTWISADSLNNGFLLELNINSESENQTDYFELNSSENVVQPKLFFKYRTINDSVDVNYDRVPAYDTFIIDEDISLEQNQILKLSNISPSRLFFKFNLPQNLFIGINSSHDFERLTINKAELVLHTESNEKYLTDHSFSVYPYLVTEDNPELPISSENYISLSGSTITTDSLTYNKDFKINITPLVQAITSGEKDNYGIIIKSIKEGKNFDNIIFDSNNIKLNIIFTPPVLDD